MIKKIVKGIISFILIGILFLGGLSGFQDCATVNASASQLDAEMGISGENGFIRYNASEYWDQVLNSDISLLSDSETAYDTSDFVGTWEGDYAGYIF